MQILHCQFPPLKLYDWMMNRGNRSVRIRKLNRISVCFESHRRSIYFLLSYSSYHSWFDFNQLKNEIWSNVRAVRTLTHMQNVIITWSLYVHHFCVMSFCKIHLHAVIQITQLLSNELVDVYISCVRVFACARAKYY